jgi:hypothetical protein
MIMNRVRNVGLLTMAGLLAAAAFFGAAAAASAAVTGSVHYAYTTPYIYPGGGPGTAQARFAVSASYDRCQPDGPPCNWEVRARFEPGPRCNADEPYPIGGWDSGWQVGNGSVSSGEQRFRLTAPNEVERDLLCLYVYRYVPDNEFGDSYLVAIKHLDPEPVAAPEPGPAAAAALSGAPADAPSSPPATSVQAPSSSNAQPVTALVLTRELARHTAKVRLNKTYASWRRAARKRVTCKKTTQASYTCAATWRYKRKTMKARLAVQVKNNKAVAQYKAY